MKNTFKILIKDSWLSNADVLRTSSGQILTKPNKRWFKLLLQYITFGWYKAPWEYTLDTRYVAGIDPYKEECSAGDIVIRKIDDLK